MMDYGFITDLFYSAFPNPKKYLTYAKGGSPIILSAPHGGGIVPVNTPKRTSGNRGQDYYTRSLIQKVIANLNEKPYYVYSDIHRKIVDLNRSKEEGTQGNKLAGSVWDLWNKTLDDYLDDVRNRFGRGLYIDIHSHGNHDKFQIGVNLSVKNYLNLRSGNSIKKHSTMYPLINKSNSEYDLVFGLDSMASTLEYNGFDVLIPKSDENYLNGGYNIINHTGNGIGSIQIECPISVLKRNNDKVAYAIASGIKRFRKRKII